MPLVAGAIGLFVVAGLFTRRLGAVQQLVCFAIAVGVALTYFFVDGIK
jgi:hypothetical protein